MFIDIHAHAYRIKPYFMFCTPKRLLEQYDALKIDMGVILPVVSPEIYLPQAVEDVVEMCQEHSDRLIPYCNVDPRAITNSPYAPLTGLLEYYKGLGCKGIGEVMPHMPLLDPMVQNLFACAEKAGLPIVFDGSSQTEGDFGLYDDAGLPQLEYTLQQYPNLLIFGHGPVFWSEIGVLETVARRGVYMDRFGVQHVHLPTGPIDAEGAVPKLFRKYPNLCGDLSDGTAYNAFARDENYGARFMSEFADRLYFGTDICSENTPVMIGDLLLSWRERGKISETVFRKIAYENAEKLLGL
ncbi:MAG: hypothetical protein E7665_04085 [Ruminococcaceae bacterium]|nr:hypothetical protein [Oscillospiraceae bacterium]